MQIAPSEWWKDFFTGIGVEMWLRAIPEEMTRVEVDFIRRMLQVAPPAKLLDAPCGGGRHSLSLAAAGYQMTGVDQSAELLAAARSSAAERKLDVTWIHRSMRDLPWRDQFDGAFCMGNSFGYDDDAGNAAFLGALWRSLKPGGRLVLDYSMVLESRLRNLEERVWCQIGDIYFLEDERYDHVHGRRETEYTFIQNGKVTKRLGSQRCYTYREICRLMEEAGFGDIQAYGSIAAEPFQFGSPCLFLVAIKNAAGP